MFKVGILTGCASDKHLSKHIFDKLKKLNIEPHYITIFQNNIINSYRKADISFKNNKYDFILAVGDRKEQIGGVIAAFDNHIPVGHLYAGDLNTGVSDDLHRAAITLYSSIQFCSCPESTENTIKLMRSAGLVPDANFVGATHFDGTDRFNLKLKRKTKESEPSILILINSEMKENDEELIKETLLKLEYFLPDEHPTKFKFIIAKGNNDSENIEKELLIEILKKTDNVNIVKEDRQDHNFFLSLIANCYMFVTNSSAAIYEAPFLIPQPNIILVGTRNRNRTKIPPASHNGFASQRVAKLIKTFLESK